MKIKTEKLKPTDWQGFYRLFQQLLKEDFPVYPQETKKRFANKVKKAFEEKKRTFWVAKINQETIGFLVVRGAPGGVTFINWLGVARPSRRQGVGRKLIQVWQKWAKKKGYHKLRALTNQRNRGFYEKLGFSLEGVRKSDAYGVDRFVFGKVIGEFDKRVEELY